MHVCQGRAGRASEATRQGLCDGQDSYGEWQGQGWGSRLALGLEMGL